MYDLVGGRAAWTVLGLPTEGRVGDRRRVGASIRPALAVPIDATIADLVAAGSFEHASAVVGDGNALLGALDPSATASHPDNPVERAMTPAPGTIRPDGRIEDALEQLRSDGVAYSFVTTARGQLLGVLIVGETHV